MILDQLLPPPREVQRRAWECAFVIGAEHSCRIGSPLFHFCQHVVRVREPETLGWAECGRLFGAHHDVFGVRAA